LLRLSNDCALLSWQQWTSHIHRASTSCSGGLVCSCLVWSGLVCSCLVWSGLVWSDLIWSGLVWSGLEYPTKGSIFFAADTGFIITSGTVGNHFVIVREDMWIILSECEVNVGCHDICSTKFPVRVWIWVRGNHQFACTNGFNAISFFDKWQGSSDKGSR
jgi:hypothetical protein